MNDWRLIDPGAVRAHLAEVALGDEAVPADLGKVTLREHQRDAAGRLRKALHRFGGALLADDVGLGKTYTALAATAALGRLLVVGPAALRGMWQNALADSERTGDFVSFESLSRRRIGRGPRDAWQAGRPRNAYEVVIVDEAHHARNPATRRYERLAALTAGAHVLLLSATPVHNAAYDLHALLALFFGTRAAEMTARELGQCVVRRTHADVPLASTPARAPPAWLHATADEAVLDALLAIPPPCPPRDADGARDAGALVTLGLVRAWSSTDAALRAALRRRLARAEALRDSLAAGRYPSRAELRAWVIGDDAMQLAFPELVSAASSGDTAHLFVAVAAHADGVSAVLQSAKSSDDADASRAECIRDIRARHRECRIVVFSQYAESVRAMFARLVRDGGVCAVTATGVSVAGGSLTRHEALARFAPLAHGTCPPRRSDAVELLLATDLLSEGLNLQDAGVVVHLDLPWTAARLAQRMGRVWRIGSRHALVFEYVISPPPPAERASAVLERLERKAFATRDLLGDTPTPIFGARYVGARDDDRPAGVARVTRAIHRALGSWLDDHARVRPGAGPADAPPGRETLVAGVDSDCDAWLAAVIDGSGSYLVAQRENGQATTDPIVVLDVVEGARGRARIPSADQIERARLALGEIIAAARASRDAGLESHPSTTHARIGARIGEIVAGAPAHRRRRTAKLAAIARTAAARARGVGAERRLQQLLSFFERVGPDDWLRQVAATASSAGLDGMESFSADPQVAAILFLGRSGSYAAVSS